MAARTRVCPFGSASVEAAGIFATAIRSFGTSTVIEKVALKPGSSHDGMNRRSEAGTARRALGRPCVDADVESLVARIAEENKDWGYRRIQGALSNLGHELARSTIADILKRHGVEPAPERRRKTTWKEFLTRHWELIVAADFFTVEVWTRRGLQHNLTREVYS